MVYAINRRTRRRRIPMLPDATGRKVPQVTFRTRVDGRWKDVTTEQIFRGRTVVLFALPGAYTPTCSTLPPAALRRAGPGAAQGGRGRGRVPVRERRVRDERVAEGPERAEHHVPARRQRRVHRGHGNAGGQVRSRLRQALVALLDAGEGRHRREDVHRARAGRRPVRGVRRRHDARATSPPARRRRSLRSSSPSRVARTAPARRRCSASAAWPSRR